MKYIAMGAFIFCTLFFGAYGQDQATAGEPALYIKSKGRDTTHLSRVFVGSWTKGGKAGAEVISITKPAMAIIIRGGIFSPDRFALLEPGDSLSLRRDEHKMHSLVLRKTTGELIGTPFARLVGCDSKPPNSDACHTMADSGALIERIDIKTGRIENLKAGNSGNLVHLANNSSEGQEATVITADEYASWIHEANQRRQREAEEQKTREAERAEAAVKAAARRNEDREKQFSYLRTAKKGDIVVCAGRKIPNENLIDVALACRLPIHGELLLNYGFMLTNGWEAQSQTVLPLGENGFGIPVWELSVVWRKNR